ncbi:knob-associated histidine-rich protein-like [Mytilus edulis]|uniref:knob-associated histidine-rich protein-like n=1 Tax=Mytilus edulis TaxID=6550 RepID=UPI0039F14574
MTSSSADYRRKLKQNDPEKFAEYLQTQKSKAKANRDRLKNELKKKKPAEWAIKRHQHQLDLAKIRQKKYDQKKRIEKKPDLETHLIVKLKLKKKKTVNTRKSLSTKREYNRLMKKKQRENMSYQKKMWIKKRDREMKMSKREQLKLESTVNTSTNTTSAFNTKKTEWNLTSKVRKIQIPGLKLCT